MQYHHQPPALQMSVDDVPLLWQQTPRFVQIMRNGSTFQHPHYFWSQSDKLTLLLNRLRDDTALPQASRGAADVELIQAHEALTELLNESQAYSALTREQLRHLEPHVRAFVEKVQSVDGFVAGWDERQQRRQLEAMSVVKPAPSKKRGRSDEDETDDVPGYASSFKRRREACGPQYMMDVETAACNNANTPVVMESSSWIQPAPAQQPVQWSESFYR